MRVHLKHTTRLDYDVDVAETVLDARVGPYSDVHQQWGHFELRAGPNAAVNRYTDGFGNAAHLITLRRRHRYLEVATEGEVNLLLEDPFHLPRLPPRPPGPAEKVDYLSPSLLVQVTGKLERLAQPFRPSTVEGSFEAVQGLMDLVHREFRYEKDVTTIATTVEEVLEGRSGVCQDFAHVLIGMCRSIGIPARYVSGYIVVAEHSRHEVPSNGSQASAGGQDEEPTRGAGASHAWVEAWTATHGWRGFDPTNNLVASQQHIKMAVGRDYRDVAPTRGTFRGQAEERLRVEVVARPVEARASSLPTDQGTANRP